MDVQQSSLSLRSPAQRRPLSLWSPAQRRPFSSGLLERRARRLQRLRQWRAVEYRQRRFRSTFLLLTLLTTCLLQQCIARLRELWTEIRSDCCAIIYFLLTTLGTFSLLSYRSKTWWEYVVLQTFYDSDWLANFRVSKDTFLFICTKLRPHIERQDTKMRGSISF